MNKFYHLQQYHQHTERLSFNDQKHIYRKKLKYNNNKKLNIISTFHFIPIQSYKMGNTCSCDSLSPMQQILQKQQHLNKQMNAITSAIQREKYCKQLAQIKLMQTLTLYNQHYLHRYHIQQTSIDTEDGQYLKSSRSMRSSFKSETSIICKNNSYLQKNYMPLKDQSSFCTLQPQISDQCMQIGKMAISNSELAVVILHGKQQNHVNYAKAIGTYDIGLDSAYTIFEILFAKLRILSKISFKNQNAKRIKVYILTNNQNKKQIIDYFKKNKYLGYGSDNIFFFSQQTIPIISKDGQIVLKSQSEIMTAPSGNGFVFWQMLQKKIIDHLQLFGVRYIFMGPINNVLMKIGDPKMLGYLIKNNKQVVCSCVTKDSIEVDNEINFGYFGTSDNGKVKIYQNLQKIPQQCKYVNTGSCVISLSFVQKILKMQKFKKSFQSNRHIVIRQKRCFNPSLQKYQTNQCLYFQFYYHDILQFASNIAVISVQSSEQFCPIKASTQQEFYSPKHARQSFWKLHLKWLKKTGYNVIGNGHIQFSPQLSYNGEGIQQYIMADKQSKTIQLPAYIH